MHARHAHASFAGLEIPLASWCTLHMQRKQTHSFAVTAFARRPNYLYGILVKHEKAEARFLQYWKIMPSQLSIQNIFTCGYAGIVTVSFLREIFRISQS